jgi:hypothetical protein
LRRRPLARIALAKSFIDILNLGEERIEAVRECVLRGPERQVPSRAQQGVSLLVADLGVDPAPGGRGVDQVEALRLALPGLERRDVNLDRHAGEIATGHVGEPRAQLDAHD